MIDFEILPILNEKVFVILDVSDYSELPNSASVSIQFPNFKKKYGANIQVESYTILNTKILNQDTCVNIFPDGIYTLEFKIDDEKIIKKVFRTINAQIKYKKLLANNNSDFDRLNKIYLYLRKAESVCDNDELAKEFYNIADKLLECN